MEPLFNSLSSFSYLTVSIALKSIFIGMVFSLVIFLVQKYLKNNFAEYKYVTLYCIIAAIIILPFISIPESPTRISETKRQFTPAEVSPEQSLINNKTSSTTSRTYSNNHSKRQIDYIPNSIKTTTTPATQTKLHTDSIWMILLRLFPILLLAGWIVTSLLLLYRVFKSYDNIMRIKHGAKLIDDKGYSFVDNALSQCKLQRPVRIGTSDDVPIPIAAGFRYPMILLPTSIMHELSKKELEIIILHELTHLKRWDDFGKLGQRIIEAVGFFNPAIKWIGHQLDLEREVACDQAVINKIGSTSKYAECLTRFMQITQGTGTTLIPGLYSSKKQIFKRFEEMFMNENKKNKKFTKYILASVITVMLLLSFTLVQVSPAIAVSGSYLTFQEVNEIFDNKNSQNLNVEEQTENDIPLETNALIDFDPDYEFDLDPDIDLHLIDASVDNLSKTSDYSLVLDGSMNTGERDFVNKRNRQGLLSRLVDRTKDVFSGIKGTAISYDDDGEVTVFWSDDRNEIRVKLYGDIEFTDDDKWIKSISDDGYLAIYERKGRHETELDIEVDKEGNFDIVYFVDDDKKDFDDEGREWAGEVLLEVIYKTGLNADKRVQRLFADGGTDAVLDDMDNIRSDYVYRVYMTELLLQENLSENDYGRILGMVEKNIDSDYEKAELLIDISPTVRQNKSLMDEYVSCVKTIDSDYEIRRVLSEISLTKETDPNIIFAVLDIAQDIDSDYEKAELLIDLSKICRDNPDLNKEYVLAMKNIDSDYETRRVFSAIGRDADMSDNTLQELLILADDLDSDYEKAEYLIELSEMVEGDLEKQLSLLESASLIDSDYEIRRVLDCYRYDCDKNPELLKAKLKVLDNMDSDYEIVESLIDHSKCAAENDEVRKLYLNSVRKVDSDYEKKRALQELIIHSDLKGDKNFIKNIINFVASMDSDYEKSEILSEVAEYCKDDEDLEEIYFDVVDNMDSEYEIEKLYDMLDKRYKKNKRSYYNSYD